MTQHRKHLPTIAIEQHHIYSQYLEREVRIDAYLPTNILLPEQMSLLLINDGQDLPKMPFVNILSQLIDSQTIEPLLCIAIYCGNDRRNEYGTAYTADYQGLGSKAGLYSKFIFDELLPFIRKAFNIPNFKDKAFAGFSLGGLSALDIVWNNASEFNKVGVFSASLWWRRKAYDAGYNDENDKLMHLQIRKGMFYPWLRFFVQCGALDETADRNNNGIIDSIDDTLDLIVELKAKGYTDAHIEYLLLENGKHDVPTWAEALPNFLQWGWGR
ncbi:MAG: alpha/beta hydrolase-fold protein [Flavobacterium sp.]|nr:alpha/beta hydrolase-fold protein [Flavobacterium sp.]